MKLERSLNQYSYLYFIGFFMLAILAFWFTYFTRLLDQDNYRMHLHGIAMILWCLMLIGQAYLIRSNLLPLHKKIGVLSYLVVPILVFTTTDLLKYRLPDAALLRNMDYHFVALVMNALVVFLIFYGLAIWFRKTPLVHARWMVCTIFPMVTPSTDRIIHIFIPSLVPPIGKIYSIDGVAMVPMVGFLLADIILITLSIWDWKSHKRWNVFPIALVILSAYHYSVLNFHQFEFWRNISRWFTEL